MKYRFIDKLKSDVMFEAYGKNLKGLFENAALALFSVICDIKKVKPKKKEKFEMKAENLEDLMYNFLSGLIAIVDTEEMFFSKIKVLEVDEQHVIAELFGEEMTKEKGGTVVKAVTYYEYKLEKTKTGYMARICLDI